MRSHVEILNTPPVGSGSRARVQIVEGGPGAPNRSSTELGKASSVIEKGDQMHTRVQFLTAEEAAPAMQTQNRGLRTEVKIQATPLTQAALPQPVGAVESAKDPLEQLQEALSRAEQARDEADRNIAALQAAIADFQSRMGGGEDAHAARVLDGAGERDDKPIVDAPQDGGTGADGS